MKNLFTRQEICTLGDFSPRSFDIWVTNTLKILPESVGGKNNSTHYFSFTQVINILLSLHLKRFKLPVETIKSVIKLIEERHYCIDRHYLLTFEDYLTVSQIPLEKKAVGEIVDRLLPVPNTDKLVFLVVTQDEINSCISRIIQNELKVTINPMKLPELDELLANLRKRAQSTGIDPNKIPVSIK
ncbi:hypothetical protein [Brasilonema sp. UFV-L1]|uniref:hypothetical protein n=1 Tax=Brasilonema sp. UFV-L1 TaxID=2234130 RepID=UPI00145F436A|nr:hypothetical protein [Brasilonema sp. UFV-L1]NMG10364.1 hypothetical protein [Brasilonema sp. UFV-L1]